MAFALGVTGLTETIAALGAFGKDAADLRPAWAQVEVHARQSIVERFATQGRGSWAPLSKSYAAWKAEHFPGRPILQRSGDLLADLTGGASKQVDELSATYFVSVPYYRFHRDGTTRMPARVPVDFQQSDLDLFAHDIQSYLAKQAAAHGLTVGGVSE